MLNKIDILDRQLFEKKFVELIVDILAIHLPSFFWHIKCKSVVYNIQLAYLLADEWNGDLKTYQIEHCGNYLFIIYVF